MNPRVKNWTPSRKENAIATHEIGALTIESRKAWYGESETPGLEKIETKMVIRIPVAIKNNKSPGIQKIIPGLLNKAKNR
jgi:hypothetical protein